MTFPSPAYPPERFRHPAPAPPTPDATAHSFHLGYSREGIRVTRLRNGNIAFTSWFDTDFTTRPEELSLGDFLRKLGYTTEDCADAIKSSENQTK